jgi:hypothetical protein
MTDFSNHPERELQNALTSPSDKDREAKTAINASVLTSEDLVEAMNTLNVRDAVKLFPKYDRLYADPVIPNQHICLHSFVPSSGATPDKDGVYGMIKVRGVFATENEANVRAEFLIRNNDSYHTIYHSIVGRPIPLSHNSKYVADTVEIDLNKKVTSTMKEDMKEKKEKDKKELEDIKKREANLLEDVKKAPEDVDPEEKYITARVKKAQLVWTYLKSLEKIEEMKKLIVDSRDLVKKMDEENPEYQHTYFERYKKARDASGLPNDDNSFMKYMIEDVDLGF